MHQETRDALQQIHDALCRDLAALTARPEPTSGIGFGKRVGDSTSIAVERITDVAKQESLLAKRQDTERAMAKLDEGTYGRCDGCGCEIGAERLAFRPYATRCVEHAA